MPVLDNDGKYIQDKGKREITGKAIDVKPFQFKILFSFKFSHKIGYEKL